MTFQSLNKNFLVTAIKKYVQSMSAAKKPALSREDEQLEMLITFYWIFSRLD